MIKTTMGQIFSGFDDAEIIELEEEKEKSSNKGENK